MHEPAQHTTLPLVDRNDLVTAALAAGGHRVRYSPAHVQKLFFLIDQELAPHVDGPHFRFEPFHYGPFDRDVYRVLNALAAMGQLDTVEKGNLFIYRLTEVGQAVGNDILAACPSEVAAFLGECARWVRVQSFRSLVTEIYARYPDMAANSRVPDLVKRARALRQTQSKSRAFVQGFGSILNLVPRTPNPFQDDVQEALADDWHAIGDDWRNLVAPFPKFPYG